MGLNQDVCRPSMFSCLVAEHPFIWEEAYRFSGTLLEDNRSQPHSIGTCFPLEGLIVICWYWRSQDPCREFSQEPPSMLIKYAFNMQITPCWVPVITIYFSKTSQTIHFIICSRTFQGIILNLWINIFFKFICLPSILGFLSHIPLFLRFYEM